MSLRTCAIPGNRVSLRSSSRLRPLKFSLEPFCISFSGSMSRHSTLVSVAQARIAFEVYAVP
jgi:hypothetical protein